MTEPTGWPHMLPCPFCGGDARHDAHADDCYLILHRKFKNSGADMSPAFEVLAAWNRRTQQPVVREPQWIDPNDKTQRQYLPHIGEPVLFCHKGTTYYGKHTGGSFVSGVGFAQKQFNTWDCHWMYPPAAHGITQKGGSNADTGTN